MHPLFENLAHPDGHFFANILPYHDPYPALSPYQTADRGAPRGAFCNWSVSPLASPVTLRASSRLHRERFARSRKQELARFRDLTRKLRENTSSNATSLHVYLTLVSVFQTGVYIYSLVLLFICRECFRCAKIGLLPNHCY